MKKTRQKQSTKLKKKNLKVEQYSYLKTTNKETKETLRSVQRVGDSGDHHKVPQKEKARCSTSRARASINSAGSARSNSDWQGHVVPL